MPVSLSLATPHKALQYLSNPDTHTHTHTHTHTACRHYTNYVHQTHTHVHWLMHDNAWITCITFSTCITCMTCSTCCGLAGSKRCIWMGRSAKRANYHSPVHFLAGLSWKGTLPSWSFTSWTDLFASLAAKLPRLRTFGAGGFKVGFRVYLPVVRCSGLVSGSFRGGLRFNYVQSVG